MCSAQVLVFDWCSLVFDWCSLVFHLCSFVFHLCSLVFYSCSFVFHLCSLVFYSCSFVFHLFTRVPLVFIRVPSVFTRVPLVFIRVPSVFTRVPLVFIRVPSVFTRGHSCSIGVHSCSDLCGVLDMTPSNALILTKYAVLSKVPQTHLFFQKTLSVACPLKGTGDYKLLLAGNGHYVYRIVKGNTENMPFRSTSKLRSQRQRKEASSENHMVMVLTLSRFTSVLYIAFVSIQ